MFCHGVRRVEICFYLLLLIRRKKNRISILGKKEQKRRQIMAQSPKKNDMQTAMSNEMGIKENLGAQKRDDDE